ncbi:hypothetical protein Tco_1107108 [Tanacetum coccineum]
MHLPSYVLVPGNLLGNGPFWFRRSRIRSVHRRVNTRPSCVIVDLPHPVEAFGREEVLDDQKPSCKSYSSSLFDLHWFIQLKVAFIISSFFDNHHFHAFLMLSLTLSAIFLITWSLHPLSCFHREHDQILQDQLYQLGWSKLNLSDQSSLLQTSLAPILPLLAEGRRLDDFGERCGDCCSFRVIGGGSLFQATKVTSYGESDSSNFRFLLIIFGWFVMKKLVPKVESVIEIFHGRHRARMTFWFIIDDTFGWSCQRPHELFSRADTGMLTPDVTVDVSTSSRSLSPLGAAASVSLSVLSGI